MTELPKLANWVVNDLAGIVKKRGLTVASCGITPYETQMLVGYLCAGQISRGTAKDYVEKRLEAMHGKT